jgi:cell division protein FtsB
MRKRTSTCGCRHSYQPAKKTGQFSPAEKKRLYILAAILVAIGLVGITFAPGIGGVALHRQHQQVRAAQELNLKLRTDNELGQKSIAAAKENPDYLEEVSRGAFNLVQRDEVILDYSKKK